MSGGGFRATLFHLGIVKALLDRGVLKDVRHITSVSGGSILAAHLVLHWHEYSHPSTFERPAREIIEFARADVRGRVFRRLLLPPYLLLPFVGGLRGWPWRLRRNGTVRNLLFEQNLRSLFGDILLSDLPAESADAPRLDILATNLTQGSLAYFSNGALVASDDQPVPIETPITVSRAVMTSALFPGFFPTVEFNAENLAVDLEKFASAQYFTDGGIYDNLGIRRFQNVLSQDACELEHVLVSDASGAFDWLVETETLGYWKTALRSSEVFMKRLADLEWELAGGDKSDQFKFLRISDVAENGALPENVQDQIKHIRTDLDRFSISEIRALVVHGYEIAARATENWTDVPAAKMVAWDPFPSVKPEPEGRWIEQLRRARFHPSGLFNLRDWPSYIYPALLILALVFFVNWFQGQRVHWHYGQQVRTNGEIVDRVENPEETKALVTDAIARPHRNQEHRLEAAYLAYALQLQQPSESSRELLERAKANLDPLHRSRFHEAKWRHFFSTLPTTTFGVPQPPDAETAIAYAEDAVGGLPPISPHHLEVALTSYAVDAKPAQTEKLKQRIRNVLDLARKNLDDAQRARFHETKWRDYYSTLPITSFGFPEITDIGTALAYAEDAVTGLPPESRLQVEAALTSYGVHSKAKASNGDMKERALRTLKDALKHLEAGGTNRLSEVDRFRTTLLKGHYALAEGNTKLATADTLKGQGKRAEAAEKCTEAESHYAHASMTYELARDLRFTDLWKVQFNVCNAAKARANALVQNIETRPPGRGPATQRLRDVIEANLEQAKQSCAEAHTLAPNEWQPPYVLALIALTENREEAAEKSFLDGYKIARRTNEAEARAYVGYLADRDDVRPLCRFTEFSRTFIAACRK